MTRCANRDCYERVAEPGTYCDAWCASQDRYPKWTPEAKTVADAQVVRTPPPDPTLCRECRRPLPPRTGKRGRPRITCPEPAPCAKRRDHRKTVAERLHKEIVSRTNPRFITGEGRHSGQGSSWWA